MRLVELERCFWNAVRRRRGAPSDLEAWLLPGAKQSASERMAIYHRAYWGRQVLYLQTTFARTVALLGSAGAERVLLDYLESSPATDPCIERIGGLFSAFLGARPGIDARCRDVAALEWAAVEALLALDAEVARSLPSGLGPRVAQCRFALSPALRIERVSGDALAWFEGKASEISEGRKRVTVAFFRARHRVEWMVVSPTEAAALEHALAGATLAELAAPFAYLEEHVAAERLSAMLAGWFSRAWIREIS